MTNKPYPNLNHLECKQCGRCVIACPYDLLKIVSNTNERGYNYVEYMGEGCIGCQNCYYTCPEPLAIEIHIPLQRGE